MFPYLSNKLCALVDGFFAIAACFSDLQPVNHPFSGAYPAQQPPYSAMPPYAQPPAVAAYGGPGYAQVWDDIHGLKSSCRIEHSMPSYAQPPAVAAYGGPGNAHGAHLCADFCMPPSDFNVDGVQS
eukprot:1138207-Pelagomonas_calceolata.AAC.3